MSEFRGGLLETKTSFPFNQDATLTYKNRSIDSDKFSAWHRDNMYKSSYAHFHSRDSTEPKNKAIPGYGGYIPYVVPENIHAKGFTPVSKDSFSSTRLAKNILGLSTNGFNVTRQAHIDHSKMGSSSKYGKTAMQRPHPSWNSSHWITTTQDGFRNPTALPNPTFRETGKFTQTVKPSTISSGFATNHAFLDGQGWIPDRVLRGDNRRSEYRDIYNAPKNFHRNTNVSKQRKLKAKEWNYKFN